MRGRGEGRKEKERTERKKERKKEDNDSVSKSDPPVKMMLSPLLQRLDLVLQIQLRASVHRHRMPSDAGMHQKRELSSYALTGDHLRGIKTTEFTDLECRHTH